MGGFDGFHKLHVLMRRLDLMSVLNLTVMLTRGSRSDIERSGWLTKQTPTVLKGYQIRNLHLFPLAFVFGSSRVS